MVVVPFVVGGQRLGGLDRLTEPAETLAPVARFFSVLSP